MTWLPEAGGERPPTRMQRTRYELLLLNHGSGDGSFISPELSLGMSAGSDNSISAGSPRKGEKEQQIALSLTGAGERGRWEPVWVSQTSGTMSMIMIEKSPGREAPEGCSDPPGDPASAPAPFFHLGRALSRVSRHLSCACP